MTEPIHVRETLREMMEMLRDVMRDENADPAQRLAAAKELRDMLREWSRNPYNGEV